MDVTVPKTTMDTFSANRSHLIRFAWLSIGAALVTMGLKGAAYWLTGSIGLLSDALESFVNLAGAIMAVAMLTVAARPPDDEHAYGHSKAEYFSSGFEGSLILIAAGIISLAAIDRLLHPRALDAIGLGLFTSAIASLVNFVVARIIFREAKNHNSITLEANASHLMVDVWTSLAVVGGVGGVAITGWVRLDPIIALLVALHIARSGVRIVRQSILGLADTALPAEDLQILQRILDGYKSDQVQFHALRTRQAGARRFISLHVLVPGAWTVQRGHELLERIESDIRDSLRNTTVFTHLESLNDPRSWQDMALDRTESPEVKSPHTESSQQSGSDSLS